MCRIGQVNGEEIDFGIEGCEQLTELFHDSPSCRGRILIDVGAEDKTTVPHAADARQDGIQAIVVKARAGDERVVLWQAKHPRRGISLLGLRGDGADLEKTEAKTAHGPEGLRAFVEARGQPDGVREGNPVKRYLELARWRTVKGTREPVRKLMVFYQLQPINELLMNLLRVDLEQQRADYLLIHSTRD